jgi:hypothetical protein
MNYECHITLNLSDAAVGEAVAQELHWKTSEIARDPVLGKASYFYLTTHDNDVQRMFQRMNFACMTLENWGVKVVREKIELIIHDTKTKV